MQPSNERTAIAPHDIVSHSLACAIAFTRLCTAWLHTVEAMTPALTWAELQRREADAS